VCEYGVGARCGRVRREQHEPKQGVRAGAGLLKSAERLRGPDEGSITLASAIASGSSATAAAAARYVVRIRAHAPSTALARRARRLREPAHSASALMRAASLIARSTGCRRSAVPANSACAVVRGRALSDIKIERPAAVIS
jgi:hypothetical protein